MRLSSRAALLAVMLAVGCSSGGSNSQPTNPTGPGGGSTSTEVAINGDAYLPSGTAVFAPDSLTIQRGTTVSWKNNDQTAHTTTSNNGVWGSTVSAGGTASHTFTTAGTFEYHCTLHAYMTGTIVVQ